MVKFGLQYFGMKNLDTVAKEKAAVIQRIQAAVKSDNTEALQAAFGEYAEMLQTAVLSDAQTLLSVSDATVLAQRGVRQLTAEETTYYNKLIDAMRSPNPKLAVTDFDVVMPKTIVDAVLDDLVEDHPLLAAIDFQNSGAVTEWLLNSNEKQLATWSALSAEIVKELTSGFRKITLDQDKLSAFLPIAKAMLDLGPAWLDRYVRLVLSESLYFGLEDGIINGRGQTTTLHEPIGMRKNLAGSVNNTTGYPDKTKVALTSLDPKSYGDLVATLAVTENGHPRVVTGVLLVVNPLDYLKKIMPATTPRATDGTYTHDVFPFPTTVIQSAQVAENEAIIGINGRYLMAAGTGKSGKIEYSDEYHFLEDERVYLTKFYGHGQPKDNTSFALLDITDLVPTIQQVSVNNIPLEVQSTTDARLAALTIGAKTLVPAFNKSVHNYTCATTDATNVINAIAKDGEATIAILNGATAVTNGNAATWSAGVNNLAITVTRNGETEVYNVAVTKS
jgi:Phage capsid family.